ncbi:hypothetical protein QP938_11595 [Porticoccaceae bacterium LTM1]|nr:hypothetical protein QP938_11595 [Porticoccaceae bacterium LTM1]
MCVFELTAILDQHHIANRVIEGHVLAKSKKGTGWIDVTDWSKQKIARWLGY